jgi:hypothetical protein
MMVVLWTRQREKWDKDEREDNMEDTSVYVTLGERLA